MTNDDKMFRMDRPPVDAARSHVIEERTRRGLSARKAAELGGGTNTVWSKFEAGGKLTPGVRRIVAQAFGWPQSWPERLPALTPEPSDIQQIIQRLDVLESLVRTLVAGQEGGLDALQAMMEDVLSRAVERTPSALAGS